MKEHKMRKIKYFILLLILVSIIFFIGLSQYISGKVPFIPGYDIRFQHRPFYSEFQTMITNSIKFSSLPFWSWNHFFGNNYWSAKVIYIIGDFYNYITLFSKQHYYNILLFQFYLKLLISAIGFFLYAKNRKWRLEVILIGSLIFAFSSWMLKYTEQPMFISFYSIIPFYFLAIEYFFQKKMKFWFSITTTVLILINYYLFFSLAFFTIIYVIYRGYEENLSWRIFIKLVISLIIYFSVGVLISSFLILPAFNFIIENSRINGSFDFKLLHTDPKVIFHILVGLFVPSNTFISGASNIFETGNYPTREILLWSSNLTSLLLFQTFFDKDIRYRNLNIFFYLVILLLLTPIGGSILNGFNYSSFRWTYLLIFMNTIITMSFLNSRTIDVKILFASIFFYISSLILVILFTPISFNSNSLQILVFALALVFMYIYTQLISKEVNYIILTLILFIELSCSVFITFQTPYFNQFTWDEIIKSESVLGKKNELMEFLYTKEGKYSFFRVYAPFDSIYWYSSLNMNLIYGTQDLKTYDSTYQTSSADIRNLMNIENHIDWYYDIKNPSVINIASVKYAVVTNEAELPHSNFEYYTNFKGLSIYLNLDYQPFIRTYSNLISVDDFTKKEDYKLLENTIISNREDYDEISKYVIDTNNYFVNNEMIFQNMIISEIETNLSTFAVSSIAYDKGWRVTINDIKVSTFSVNGGFIGFNIPEKGGTIKMYFQPVGFKQGVIISIIGAIILLLLTTFEIYNKKKTR